MRPRHAVFGGLLVAAVIVAVGVTSGSASTTITYLNAQASVSARVSDLLGRMTVAEKVGQMDQIVVEKLRNPSSPANGDCNGANGDPLQITCLQNVLVTDHTGSILSGGSDNPPDNTGTGWTKQYNTIQRYAIQHSRLHIPIIYGVDAVHGFGHPYQATLFPQSIGMGATWDQRWHRPPGRRPVSS